AAGGDQKYIVCNADEGDSGTFSDRMLMEGDPYTLIEAWPLRAWRFKPPTVISMCGPNTPTLLRRCKQPLPRPAAPAGWAARFLAVIALSTWKCASVQAP